ncbi:MAG: GxxExxY protein [Planctomycetes bacterium]|nr:GxxExxY protein [Planctomycetota bacterium]
MNHRATETQRINGVTEKIIGAAKEVHRALGPGLLESAYLACLVFELTQSGLNCRSEISIPVRYKDVRLDCGYRADLIVEDLVIVELKAVERLLPVHDAQLITYLKITGLPLGLLLNFNVPLLKDGIRRLVNPSVTL